MTSRPRECAERVHEAMGRRAHAGWLGEVRSATELLFTDAARAVESIVQGDPRVPTTEVVGWEDVHVVGTSFLVDERGRVGWLVEVGEVSPEAHRYLDLVREVLSGQGWREVWVRGTWDC